MKLESHILGIPFALIIFVLIDAIVVGLIAILCFAIVLQPTSKDIKNIKTQNAVIEQNTNKLLVTPSPTATPTVVPTFAPKAVAPVVKTTVKPVAK